MIASYPDRHFQVWEFHVSHGCLLVRSPRKPSIATNIDIVFAGVEFMSLPRHLKGVDFAKATPVDIQWIVQALGRDIPPDQAFVLISEGTRHPVVASGYDVSENEADIFDSRLT